MSFNNYSQYLGRQKCCDLRGIGPQGATGPRGPQGAIGSVGYTGATGPMGPTGVPGVTGPPANQNLESVLSVGNNAGATGINMNLNNIDNINILTCDVGTGNTSILNVSSLTINDSNNNNYIQLDNALSALVPTINVNDGTSNLLSRLTGSALTFANGLVTATLNKNGTDFIMSGDNSCRVICDSKTQDFYAGDPFGSSNGVSVAIYQSSRNITLDSNSGTTNLGDINSIGNSTKLIIDDITSKIQLNANSPIYVPNSGIQMSSQYNTTSQVFTTDSKYIQTFDGASLTATLPSINSTNVGIQFLITNIDATTLVVSSDGVQTIYLSGSSATSQIIPTNYSYLLTSIQNGAATYGWTMN